MKIELNEEEINVLDEGLCYLTDERLDDDDFYSTEERKRIRKVRDDLHDFFVHALGYVKKHD